MKIDRVTRFFLILFLVAFAVLTPFSVCALCGVEIRDLWETADTWEDPFETWEDLPVTGQTEPPETEPPEPLSPFYTADPSYFADALFIGDSRMVGISEYGTAVKKATFFCGVGMSPFNIGKAEVSVPELGKVTLVELLRARSFGKIYLMLGINELGYPMNSRVRQYRSLVGMLMDAQPDALLFVCANLRLAASRSDTDKIYNNRNLDAFNKEIAKLADQKRIFYIDVNPIFDDGNGNLDAKYTGDGTHIFGKYYPLWADWFCTVAVRVPNES